MARPSEVFVRELDLDEAQRLVKITRTAKDRVRLRRIATDTGHSFGLVRSLLLEARVTLRRPSGGG